MDKVKRVIGYSLSICVLLCSLGCSGRKPDPDKLIKMYKKLTQSEAYQALKMYRRTMTIYELGCPYYHPCSLCNGYGVVYYVGQDGKPLECDMNGNVVLHICPECKGDGRFTAK